VPLYGRLAAREDLEVRVFFTWHAGDAPVHDRGFNQEIAWDIPLKDGYSAELVPNTSRDAGTHHFFGLRNPALVERILAWKPDAVHVTGWAWASHLSAIGAFHRRGIPVLFRGDSHLLDGTDRGPAWWLKRTVLGHVYSWPSAFLYVGEANREYYRLLGVDPSRLYACPHSIEVRRFAEAEDTSGPEAARWRAELGITADQSVLLFAGKFEAKKRPLELMRTVQTSGGRNLVLILAGGGELERDVQSLAAQDPARFRVLPFQNQSRMPTLYRMGDLFVLPSAFGETWGLAVNEAMACGRPVLLSDRVGCASDVVDARCGRVFPWADLEGMMRAAHELVSDRQRLREMGRAAAQRAWRFDTSETERSLMACLNTVVPR